MRTFCAVFAVVCFGALAAELFFHAHDHLWLPHALTYFFSGIAAFFSYKAAGYRR